MDPYVAIIAMIFLISVIIAMFFETAKIKICQGLMTYKQFFSLAQVLVFLSTSAMKNCKICKRNSMCTILSLIILICYTSSMRNSK